MKSQDTEASFRRSTPETFSVRPSWIVCIANLGRLSGQDHDLIGVATDIEFQTVHYGVMSAGEIAGIESVLGKALGIVMDAGQMVQAKVRIQPLPKRLVSISTLPVESSTKIDVWQTSTRERRAALEHQQQCGERFAEQRTTALKLRKRWNIGSMRHRGDWPDFLPAEWREFIREHSRTWLELHNAPEGFEERSETKPPPLPWSAQTTRHPTFPQCPA